MSGNISALYSAQEETVSSVKISNKKLQIIFFFRKIHGLSGTPMSSPI